MGRNNMSNNIDFKLKNAVEVGKDIKVTLGSITSSDIDLATGNYFAETLAANTTYTLSNAGDVQSFQLEVTGASSAYDIANGDYDSVSFSVSSQSTAPAGIEFNNDGTKMYMVGGVSAYQYTLSTAFDLSTASYDSVSFSLSGQDSSPYGIAFNTNGTKMYMVGLSSDSVYQYSLSTAFNLSTASYDSVSLDVSSQDTFPVDITFNNDGTKMYMVGFSNDLAHEYTLSTAYDLSTASYGSVSLDVSSQDGAPVGLAFSADGTRMFIIGNATDNVFQYSLSTAFDLSTASYDTVSFSISSQESAPSGMAFNGEGTKMYVVGSGTDTVYQYSTSAAATLTWPSSIEWAGGVAPSAPATGETDVFTFVTDDGGTSYVGLKTADNLR